uniref:Sorting nexin-17 n=1 Tax=Phallusia mammillata TaxID=59560 RepID=A0A6F9DU07_9ASCI|nr:sorting nexin-17-like [Phallusia mammillata]
MHFSIPDTDQIQGSTSSYKVYNIHVNGVLQCSVRYSQLHDLNEKLKKEFGAQNLPPFPPKRIFTLKGDDLQDRKAQLEQYIQEISQDSTVSSSEIFNDFLRKAQQETRHEEKQAVSLSIFLVNGSKLDLDVYSTDKTNHILEKFLTKMNLPEDLMYYFGLYLVRSEGESSFSVVRVLQEFECPYISLKSLRERRLYKIILRKAFWDQSFDKDVITHRIGLNLLQVQAESDIAMGWIKSNADSTQRLSQLLKKGSKLEYVQFCQTLPGYGYIEFKPCIANYPQKKSEVVVSVGNYEIKFRSKDLKQGEEIFSVTRIKCWKVSSENSSQDMNCNVDTPVLQLSFEYLVSKGNLRWVCLLSDQAIMMSMSIKSMVNELIRKRKGEKMRRPGDHTPQTKPTFKPRDKSTEVLFDPSEIQDCDSDMGSIQKAKDSLTKIADKLTGTSIISSKQSDESPAFVATTPIQGNIGDDDL